MNNITKLNTMYRMEQHTGPKFNTRLTKLLNLIQPCFVFSQLLCQPIVLHEFKVFCLTTRASSCLTSVSV